MTRKKTKEISRERKRVAKDSVESIRPIEPNKYGIAIANALRAAREGLNFTTRAPPSRGLPAGPEARVAAGTLLMGQSPEVIEDMAHGFMPTSGRGQTFGLDPEVVDVIGIPTLGAGTAVGLTGKATVKGLRKGMSAIADKPVKQGRREFLKNTGKVAAVGATGGFIPDLLRAGKKSTRAKIAVVKAASKITIPSAAAVLKKFTKDAMKEFKHTLDSMKGVWDIARFPKQHKQHQAISKRFDNLPEDFDVSKTYSKGQLKDIDDFLAKLPDDGSVDYDVALGRALGDPNTDMADLGDMGDAIRWRSEGGIAHNPRFDKTINDVVRKKIDEAEEALIQLDGTDIDLWHATGEVPEAFPDELVPYLDQDYFREVGGKISAWDDQIGMHYGPDANLQQYLESSDDFVVNLAEHAYETPEEMIRRMAMEGKTPVKDP